MSSCPRVTPSTASRGEHRSHFVGDDVRVSSPQGRFVDADRLDGRALRAVEAYGKHLLYEFDGRRYVHVHLGLFGKVWTAQQPAPAAGPTVRMRLAVDDWFADLVGPTRCRLIDGDQRAMLLAGSVRTRCGATRDTRASPSPASPAAASPSPPCSWTRASSPASATSTAPSCCSGVRRPVPSRAPRSPPRPGVDLWQDARTLMRAGVRSGRIITTEPARPRVPRARGARDRRALRLPPDRALVPTVPHRRSGPPTWPGGPLLVPDLSEVTAQKTNGE